MNLNKIGMKKRTELKFGDLIGYPKGYIAMVTKKCIDNKVQIAQSKNMPSYLIKSYEHSEDVDYYGNLFDISLDVDAKYYDMSGRPIKVGDTLIHGVTGEVETVYAGTDGEIGFNATNPEFISNLIGYAVGEIYPLHNFRMKEWKIK